jgi:hypothetical protein
MPLIRREQTIAANATLDNVVTGSIYEFLPWNAAINIGLNGSATGLVATINSGSDTVLEEAPVNVSTAFPVIPDDMFAQDVAAGGERLVIKIRNTTGGALVLRSLIQFTPV